MSDVAIGVDVGGTKILALLLERDGRVIDEVQVPTPRTAIPDQGAAIAQLVAEQARVLADRRGLNVSEVALGVGLPGMFGRDGYLAFAPNLSSAVGLERATFAAILDNDRVVVENDANCAARAEREWGGARDIADFMMVTIGTGIGGGFVHAGRLFAGEHGYAAEIGHMVVQANGVACPCGASGCWERYASGGALVRLAREHGARFTRPEDVTNAAAMGDEEALALIDEFAWWLALGLANLVAVLDVAHFVIGGGFSVAAEVVLPRTRVHLDSLVEGASARRAINVVPAAFGPRSGAMGAALVGFEATS